MALTRSHRTNYEKELINWDRNETYLKAEIKKKTGPCTLELAINEKGKKAKINGLEQKKISNYIGACNVVLFAPEDLEIVKGAPSFRRKFIDMEIAQMFPSYVYDLTQYHKILIQRNHQLKQQEMIMKNKEMLKIWDEQLVHFGIKIIKKRFTFLEKLQKWVNIIHDDLTLHKEKIHLLYQSSMGINEIEDDCMLIDQYMVKLSVTRETELRRGLTLIGPHRDDLLIKINDQEAKQFGSQGQQRTVALSLKLAEIEMIYEEIGEYPILLLDDVLSELDESRQYQIIQSFQKKVQTFITTTNLASLQQKNVSQQAQTYQVTAGKCDRS